MQMGARVALDPSGGNTVDVAALFRGKREKVATNGGRFGGLGDDSHDSLSSGDGRGGDYSRLSHGTRGGGVGVGGGKRFLEDEYDNDDGFIDNDDIAVDDWVGDEEAREEAQSIEPAFETVYEGFYVNRGDIELRKISKKKDSRGATKEGRDKNERKSLDAQKGAPAQQYTGQIWAPNAPKEKSDGTVAESKGTVNVSKSREVELSAGKLGVAEKIDKPGTKPNKTGDMTSPASGKKHKIDGKADVSGGAPQPKRKKSSEGQGLIAKRVEFELPSDVLRLVEDMRALCVKLYGDKKPSVNKSPELQELLRKLVGAALDAGVARLKPDGHVMALPPSLWTLLNFLRTTRSNLETLAWALHWHTQETKAVEAIAATELALRSIVMQKPGPSVVWSPELKNALRNWWEASLSRVDASNQLCEPGKKQVARKRLGTLCDAITKSAFSGYAVSKEALAEQVRLLEEEAREERREAKATKKRERDEARAAAAKVSGSGSAGGASGGKKSVLSQLASLTKNGSAASIPAAGGGVGGGGTVKESSKVTGPPSCPANTNKWEQPKRAKAVVASAAAVAAAAAAARSSKAVAGRAQSMKASAEGPSKKAAAPKPRWKPAEGITRANSGTTSAPGPSSRPDSAPRVASGSSAQNPRASLPTGPTSGSEKKTGKTVKHSKNTSSASVDTVIRQASFASGAPRPQPPPRPQDGSAALRPGPNQLNGDKNNFQPGPAEANPKSISVPQVSSDNFEVIELD